MINIAVIGCGKSAGQYRLPEIEVNPSFNLVAVYDIVSQRAEETAKQYGVRHCTTLEEILEDKGIDAICVCTPNASHRDITIKAQHSGKHVLCQAPISSNLQHALEMMDHSRTSGKVFMIAHQRRYLPAYREAKKILSSKKLGKVLNFNIVLAAEKPKTRDCMDIWTFRNESFAYGVAIDLGVEATDLFIHLVGFLNETTAFANCIEDKLQDGTFVWVFNAITCAMKSVEVQGTVAVSWLNNPDTEESFTLLCENGILRVKDGSLETTYIDGVTTRHSLPDDTVTVVDAFADAILNDGAHSTAADGYQALRRIIASLESSRIKRAVLI